MFESSVGMRSGEHQSLEQRRASHRAELQKAFLHEREHVKDAVLMTEDDLIIACAMRKYSAPGRSFY